MRRPGPDDIEDTEADHLDTGHTALAVQGEGHDQLGANETRKEARVQLHALEALAQPHTALAHRILGPLVHAPGEKAPQPASRSME